ncbi:MAG: PhoH family protein [Spirochaetaceae bacterium]|nr:PhoH family protein [Spirochaetaceae bacterium]
MHDGVTIILDNRDLAQSVCGSNDANLKAIEKSLACRVTVRGNELRPVGLDEKGEGKFKQVMDNLIDLVHNGEIPSPDYVRALAGAAETEAGAGNMKDSIISIPHAFSKVFPRSNNQALYINAIRSCDVNFSVGPAGTGKTFLAIAVALSMVLSKKIRKLVLTRPVVESGESLGFLPGDLEQKINPYLRPLHDAMESLIPYETIARLEENRLIEIAPLAYMRGRSFNDAFIILDEAQNTTKEQMKMFLTRLGNGSRAVITGDITQIDLPKHIESGLLHAISILSSIDGIKITKLYTEDVVRNPLIKKIIQAYDDAQAEPAFIPVSAKSEGKRGV